MNNFIAVMKWDGENRVAKYMDFASESDAQAHIDRYTADYPDAFIAPKAGDISSYWLVDFINKSISLNIPPPKPPPTDEERIDAAFPQTDVARVIFEVFFEMANQIRALQDTVNGTTQGPLTRTQLKDFMKTKLP
jgi:hypothetical protein